MKAAELFDELLELTVSYPRTLMFLLFGRSAHFADTASSSRCPTGAFVFLTFVAIYAISQALTQDPLKLPGWMKEEFALALIFAGVGVLVNIQASVLGMFMVEFRPSGVFEKARLAYPYSVTVLATTIVFFTLSRNLHPYSILVLHILYLWTILTVLRGSGLLSLSRAILGTIIVYGSALVLALLIFLVLKLAIWA